MAFIIERDSARYANFVREYFQHARYTPVAPSDIDFVEVTDAGLDIRLRLNTLAWEGYKQTYIGRWAFGGTDGSKSFLFGVNADGTAFLKLSADGTSEVSVSSFYSVVVQNDDYSVNPYGWVRVTWRKSDGLVTFYNSRVAAPVATDVGLWPDADWALLSGNDAYQLGEGYENPTDLFLNIGSIYDAGDTPIVIGGPRTAGASGVALHDPLYAKVYLAQVFDGIDGQLICDWNPELDATNGVTSFTATSALGDGDWDLVEGTGDTDLSGPTGPPTTLTVTPIAQTTATLHWVNGETRTGTTTVIQVTDGVSAPINATVPVGVASYDVAGLVAAQPYIVNIAHVYGGYYSSYLTGSFTTLEGATGPAGPPATLTVTPIAQTTATLHWVNGETRTGTVTVIQITDGIAGPIDLTAAAGVTSKAVTGLVAGRVYLVSIAHLYESEYSTYLTGSFTTLEEGVDPAVPVSGPIVDCETLHAAVARFLNRNDLADEIPVFVQLAEARFHEDERVRTLVTNDAFVIDDEVVDLPDNFKELEALEINGPSVWGVIETIGADNAAYEKARLGLTGIPCRVTLLPANPVGGTARFSPAPSGSFSARMTYWAGITPLCAEGAEPNWLIVNYPNIYLFGVLCEAAPYLENDERVALWEQKLDRAIESLRTRQSAAMFGGTMRQRFRTFGG